MSIWPKIDKLTDEIFENYFLTENVKVSLLN